MSFRRNCGKGNDKNRYEQRPQKEMEIDQLHSLFRLHFVPERIKFHSRAHFSGILGYPIETAEDVSAGKSQTKSEYDEVIPAELIATKFYPIIGRSSGNYEQRSKQIKRNVN